MKLNGTWRDAKWLSKICLFFVAIYVSPVRLVFLVYVDMCSGRLTD